MESSSKPSQRKPTRQRRDHALAYSRSKLPRHLDLTLSEALVLGLLKQNVHVFFAVLGHGSTEESARCCAFTSRRVWSGCMVCGAR